MKTKHKEQPDYLGLRLLEIMNRKTCVALGKQNEYVMPFDPVSTCEHGRTLRKSTWRSLMKLGT
jgi:hypothetical protein